MERRFFQIDLRKCEEKEAGHRYLAELFSFPDYYGKNLDALWDLLSPLAPRLRAELLLPGSVNAVQKGFLDVFWELEKAGAEILLQSRQAELSGEECLRILPLAEPPHML